MGYGCNDLLIILSSVYSAFFFFMKKCVCVCVGGGGIIGLSDFQLSVGSNLRLLCFCFTVL